MDEKTLLIIWHSRTGTAQALAAAAAEGSGAGGMLLHCADVGPEELLRAGGYLFACPENLASMSGAMKEMFDRCYYPVLGQLEGRPYASIIAAGSDGEGAQRQLDRIARGWRMKRVLDGWIVNTRSQTPEEILQPKTVASADLQKARDWGAAMAEALSVGIY